MVDLSGRTIKGYALRECIGTGGFGAVYRAHQPVVDRDVAVKVILPEYANQPDFILCFESEAQRMMSVSHPHIVPLYDYWRDAEGAYLVTRWLPASLQASLRQGPWSLRAVDRLFGQITSALALAHSHNLLHCNIKPSNILLDEDQNAYLADFASLWALLPPGQASRSGPDDDLAPELLKGNLPTPRTDIFGLGALLLKLFTAPLPGAEIVGPAAHMTERRHERTARIQSARPELPGAVAAVIETAIARNPLDRYSDVMEMAAAFDSVMATLTSQSASPPEALTERELVILRLAVDDLSNSQIAERLSLSAETVRWYFKRLYAKLDVHSRMQAVRRAQELGLLHPIPGSGQPARSRPRPSTHTIIPAALTNPYKGLRAFEEGDAADFFGREALTGQLIARLSEDGPFSRFLAVIGPSGSGKSSVVRAGLIPALRRGALPGSDKWFISQIRPGTHPFDELQIALTGHAVHALPNMLDELRRNEWGLLSVAREILPKGDNQLLLVIDQFEEAFTLVRQPADTTRLLNSLYVTVVEPDSPIRVIVTLRADFFDRPLMHEGFSELLDKRTQVVGPLHAEELERAIVAPARRVGVSMEEGLAAAISFEVNQQPGALPLLQYALTELFERRTDSQLTLSVYREMKGVRGALARRAEDVYAQLGDDEQRAAKQVFLRLVTLGEGVEDTRRRAQLAELQALGDAETVKSAIDAFDHARLLTFDRDPAAHSPTVEVAHEAILREWVRLRAWLDESRSDVRLQRLLGTSTADWLAANRDTSYLLHGGRLALYKSWRQTTAVALTDDERAYLDTSLQAEQRAAALRRRVRRTVVGVAVAVAVVMTVLAVLARIGQLQAERQAAVNRSLVLSNAALALFESDGSYALPLALEAVNLDDPPVGSINALQQIAFGAGNQIILRETGNPIKAVAFSPDGQRVLSGSCVVLDSGICNRGELTLWDMQTQAEIWRVERQRGAVIAAAFAADGQTVLSAAEDGSVMRWTADTGDSIGALTSGTSAIHSAAFGPDARLVVTAGADGLVRIWDVDAGTLRHVLDSGVGAVSLIALSADGKLVAADAGSNIVIWDVATGNELRRLTGHTDTPTAFAFRSTAPDGYTVLSSSQDTTFLETDVASGDVLHRSVVMSDFFAIAVSPDGSVALPSSGFGPQLWDVERWTETQTVGDRLGKVESAAFSPDGKLVLMGHASGMLRLLGLPVSPEVRRYVTNIPLESIDVSPDGRYLVGGAFTGGEAALFDVESGREIRRFPMPEDMVLARFSPDGRLLAIGSANYFPSTREHTILLVDVATGKTIHELEGLVYHPRSMAFTPDGKYVLVGSLEWGTAFEGTGAGDLLQWDVSTGALFRRYDETRAVFGIVFSPDGRQFVTMTDSQGDPVRAKVSYLTLWDLESGERIERYYDWPETGLASSAAWDPDGKHVFVGGFGGLARLDLETGKAPFAFRGLGSDTVFGLDISPDGRYLAAGDIQVPSTFIVWDRATGREILRQMPYDVPTWDVVFGPTSRTVFTSPYGPGPIIQWQIPDLTLDELLAWVRENRRVRMLTCEERLEFTIPPLCETAAPQLAHLRDMLIER